MEIVDSGNGRHEIRFLIIACICLLVLTVSAWILSDKPLGGHECFVSVTAREMLLSGDWVVPTYNNEQRLQKTPLNYWVVAFLGSITGEVTDVVARAGSMIFALVSVFAIFYFVSRLLGFRIAAISVMVWVTSLSFFRYGQSARPEMSLTAFVAISFLSFYSGMVESSRRRQIVYMLIFWVSFSLAMLAKGPAPLPLVGIPLLAWVAVNRKWSQISRMLPVIGGAIFVAVVLAWPVLLAYRLGESSGETDMLGFWKKEFVGRFLGTHDSGDKPFYYYLPVIFQLMVPWSIFVPMGLMAPFYKVWQEKRKIMMFLWICFVGEVVFMSLSGGKRVHYILPAMPCMSILIGIIIEDIICEKQCHSSKFASNMMKIHFFVLFSGIVGCGAFLGWKYPYMLSFAATSIALLILSYYFFMSSRRLKAAVLFIGSYVFLQCGVFIVILAPQSKLHYSKHFAKTVASIIGEDQKAVAYRDVSSRFVHYFGRAVPVSANVSAVRREYENGSWIIAHGSYLEELLSEGSFKVTHQWQNTELTKDKPGKGALFHKDN